VDEAALEAIEEADVADAVVPQDEVAEVRIHIPYPS
jgi:hypothetical protein